MDEMTTKTPSEPGGAGPEGRPPRRPGCGYAAEVCAALGATLPYERTSIFSSRASSNAVTSSGTRQKRTFFPRAHAATPSAVATCVLPVPELSTKSTFSRFSTNSPRSSSTTRCLSNPAARRRRRSPDSSPSGSARHSAGVPPHAVRDPATPVRRAVRGTRSRRRSRSRNGAPSSRVRGGTSAASAPSDDAPATPRSSSLWHRRGPFGAGGVGRASEVREPLDLLNPGRSWRRSAPTR